MGAGTGAVPRTLNRARRHVATTAVVALIVVLGGVSTVAVGLSRRDAVRDAYEERYAAARVHTVEELRAGLDRYAMVLRGAASYVMSSTSVRLDEFIMYGTSLRLDADYGGMSDIGYFASVPWDERGAYARHLAERAPGAVLDVSGPPRELVVAELLVKGTEQVGRDVSLDPVRREALDRARDSGSVAASRAVVQIDDERLPPERRPQSVIMYAPVYDAPMVPSAIEPRREYLIGWTALAFRVPTMLAALGLGGDGLDVWVSVAGAPSVSAQGESSSGSPPLDAEGVRRETLDVFGHEWTVTFRPTGAFGGVSDEWKSLMWAGASTTLGLAVVAGLLGTQRARLRRQVEAALAQTRESNRRLEREASFQRALLANLQVGVIAVDAAGNLASYNLASEGLYYGELPQSHDGSWSELLGLFTTSGALLPEEHNPMRRALRGERVRGMELVVRPRNSAERVVHCNGQSIVDADGNTLGAVVVVHDITPLKQAEQRLVELAHQDALTGLPNRTVLTEQTAIALLATERNGTRVALVFLDLDGFKRVNDAHGHDVGDELLRVAAARLRQAVRHDDLVSRLGGDEFVVLLRDLTPGEAPEVVVERIEDSLGAPYLIGELRLQVGVSAGFAIAVPGDDAASLQRRADQAMYHAKAVRRRSAGISEF